MQRIIQAAQELLCLESERLRGLLQRSNALLAPLADPLLTDFGTHRQLQQKREEAYSDWLQWIIEQLKTPEYVFRLFGIDDPAGIALCQKTHVTAEREAPVPQGHDGQSGKLDLVVRYAEKVLIVIEVKMTDAEAADTEKHRGYMKWIKRQPEPRKPAILLVPKAAKEDDHGFAARRWDDLCIELRKIARTLCREPLP